MGYDRTKSLPLSCRPPPGLQLPHPPFPTTHHLLEPVLRTQKRKNIGKSSLSMIEIVVLLAGRDRNLLNLSDPRVPKKLEDVRYDLFFSEQAGDLYHFRASLSQLPTRLSPQIIYLGFPCRALFKEMLSGSSPTRLAPPALVRVDFLQLPFHERCY
jgi:hypothetical protein